MVQNKIDKEKAQRIERIIKSKLAEKGLTLTNLAYLINERGEKTESPQTLSQKLKRGTIKYADMEDIAQILGYKIKWLEIE